MDIRMLTEHAARTRFNFEWSITGCKVPILGIESAATSLRQALENALDWHGVLDEARCGANNDR